MALKRALVRLAAEMGDDDARSALIAGDRPPARRRGRRRVQPASRLGSGARHAARLDQRRSLDNLRALSEMFACCRGITGRRVAPALPQLPVIHIGTSFLRFAIGALVAVAALQVAAAPVTDRMVVGAAIRARHFAEAAECWRSFLCRPARCCCSSVVVATDRARLLGVVFRTGRVLLLRMALSWPPASPGCY